jgi:hypothetical protein
MLAGWPGFRRSTGSTGGTTSPSWSGTRRSPGGEWLVGRLTEPRGCSTWVAAAGCRRRGSWSARASAPSASACPRPCWRSPSGRRPATGICAATCGRSRSSVIRLRRRSFALIMLSRRDIPPLLTQLRGPKLLQVAVVLGDFDELPISSSWGAGHGDRVPARRARGSRRAGRVAILEVNEVRAEAERNRLEVRIYLRATGSD